MYLIQVDPIGSQSPKTVLDCGKDISSRSTFLYSRTVHGHAKFGCKDNLLAMIAKDLPKRLLGAATFSICIGSIEQSDASIQGLVHHLAGNFHLDAATEVIASEAY
jgi:hypothetical protein